MEKDDLNDEVNGASNYNIIQNNNKDTNASALDEDVYRLQIEIVK